MNETLLQPPELTVEQQIAGEERQYRIERAYNEAFEAAMYGKDDNFWTDCHQSIYDAVKEAMAGGFDAKWFKATISMAVRLEAERYAAAVAKDTD